MNINVVDEIKHDSSLTFNETEYFITLNKELDALLKNGEINSLEKERILSLKSNEYETFKDREDKWSHKSLLLKKYPQIFSIHDLLINRNPSLKKYFIAILHKDKEILERELDKLSLEIMIYEVSGWEDVKMLLYVFKTDDSIDMKTWIKDFNENYLLDIGFYYYPNTEVISGSFSSYWLKMERFMEPDIHSLSNIKKGFREDLGRGYRSSWEANIARWLNYLNIEFEYESELLITEAGPYNPDFVIREKFGAYLLEVKGWLDRRSKDLVVAFIREKFQGYDYELIDGSFYALLEEKYASIVPNWEPVTTTISNQIAARTVGLTVGARMKAVKELSLSESVTLEWEKNNTYDPFAMKVVNNNGMQIGYVSKDLSPYFAVKMQQGFELNAKVKSIDLVKNVVHITVYFNGEKSILDKLENKLKEYVDISV